MGHGLTASVRVAAVGAALAAAAVSPRSVLADDGSFLSPIAMPAKTAGFSRGAVRSYEMRAEGKSVRYQNRRIWADVYVYDRDRPDLPAAYDEKVAKDELSSVWNVLSVMKERGLYKDATLLESFAVGDSPGRFDCFHAKIVNGEGTPLDSWACLTTRCGVYLKVRLSGPEGTKNPMRAFLKPWSKVVCARTASAAILTDVRGDAVQGSSAKADAGPLVTIRADHGVVHPLSMGQT